MSQVIEGGRQITAAMHTMFDRATHDHLKDEFHLTVSKDHYARVVSPGIRLGRYGSLFTALAEYTFPEERFFCEHRDIDTPQNTLRVLPPPNRLEVIPGAKIEVIPVQKGPNRGEHVFWSLEGGNSANRRIAVKELGYLLRVSQTPVRMEPSGFYEVRAQRESVHPSNSLRNKLIGLASSILPPIGLAGGAVLAVHGICNTGDKSYTGNSFIPLYGGIILASASLFALILRSSSSGKSPAQGHSTPSDLPDDMQSA